MDQRGTNAYSQHALDSKDTHHARDVICLTFVCIVLDELMSSTDTDTHTHQNRLQVSSDMPTRLPFIVCSNALARTICPTITSLYGTHTLLNLAFSICHSKPALTCGVRKLRIKSNTEAVCACCVARVIISGRIILSVCIIPFT